MFPGHDNPGFLKRKNMNNGYCYHFVPPEIKGDGIGELLLKQTRGEFLTRAEKDRVKKYAEEQRKKKLNKRK